MRCRMSDAKMWKSITVPPSSGQLRRHYDLRLLKSCFLFCVSAVVGVDHLEEFKHNIYTEFISINNNSFKIMGQTRYKQQQAKADIDQKFALSRPSRQILEDLAVRSFSSNSRKAFLNRASH